MAEGLGDLEGQVLDGRYRLGHKIGQGGMGAVYQAMQTSLGRQVAIKVLLPILSGDASLVTRFRAEAERSGHLNHPHIVQILDFGREESGSVWIAMELLEGEPLTDRIARGPLSEADAVRFAREALAGLEAAHGARLVHRDLKPDNIFLTTATGVGERVKLLDFGIAKLLDGDSAAKLTATGLVIGTPLYMSSEQARGDDLDERSDIYSLGAVMYECLTGEPPFTGRNYNALLVAVLTQTAKPITALRPDLSPGLAAIVMRALDKDKNARFASAKEMSAALGALTPSTETPSPKQEMSLAATMATPEAGVVVPQVSQAAQAPQAVQAAQAAQGHAEEPPRAIASTSARNAVTEGTGTTPKVGPQRRHGWLLPSMVAVALLAGMGTAAFVGLSGEGPNGGIVAVNDSPAELTVVPQPGAPAPVLPVEPGASPRPPPMPARPGVDSAPAALEPRDGVSGHEEPDAPTPVVDESSEEEARPERPDTKQARMTRRARVSIRITGGTLGGHREWRTHLSDHASWSSCWPRSLPYPDMNRGLTINARTTPDGALSDFSVRGNDNYPTVATCLMEKLQGGSVGPSRTGEGGAVQISFGLYETRR